MRKASFERQTSRKSEVGAKMKTERSMLTHEILVVIVVGIVDDPVSFPLIESA